MDRPVTPPPVDAVLTISTAEAATKQAARLIPILERGKAKRALPENFDFDISPLRKHNNYRTPNITNSSLAKEKVEEAFQLIVDATGLLQHDKAGQNRLLDLQAIFRNYREGTAMPTATAKLDKQIASLEATVNRISQQTKMQACQTDLAPKGGQKPVQAQSQGGDPAIPKDLSTNSLLGLPLAPPPSGIAIPTYATVLSNATSNEWSTANKQALRAQKAQKPQETTLKPCRIMLQLKDKDITVNPIALRDSINKELDRNPKEPTVLCVRKTMRNNLLLVARNPDTKKHLISNLPTVHNKIIQYNQILHDEEWHQVVIHGISTTDFAENGPEKVKYEIETYNRDLKCVTLPQWLTSEEKRSTNRLGSMIVAFATKDEAIRARIDHLWIGAKSVRVVTPWTDEERNEQREKQKKKTQDQPIISIC